MKLLSLFIVLLFTTSFVSFSQDEERSKLDFLCSPLNINTDLKKHKSSLTVIKKSDLWIMEAEGMYDYTVPYIVDLKKLKLTIILENEVERIEVFVFEDEEDGKFELYAYTIYFSEKAHLTEEDLTKEYGEILVSSILFDEVGNEVEYPSWFSLNTVMTFMDGYQLSNGKSRKVIKSYSGVGG